MSLRRDITTALLFISLVSLNTRLLGATKTWDGGAASANWSDAANWNADGVPTSSDAVVLDNSVANPVPQVNASSGTNCGTLTIDGVVSGTFPNYGGTTPLVTNLYGASANVANTGPLLSVTSDFGGSGFAVGGSGNDVALQRIDDPSPSGAALSVVGATNEAVVQLSFSWLDNATNETGYRVYRVLGDSSLELVEMGEGEACCGFGGTFAVKYPQISTAMAEVKCNSILETGSAW